MTDEWDEFDTHNPGYCDCATCASYEQSGPPPTAFDPGKDERIAGWVDVAAFGAAVLLAVILGLVFGVIGGAA